MMRKLFVFMSFVTTLVVILFVFSQKDSFDLRSRAQEDADFCKNTCSGYNRCDFSFSLITGDPNINAPCCEELARTGDAGACTWPQRGYCADDQCAAITGDKMRCGGPRHSWCNLCVEHKCPGYVNTPTSLPTVIPTKKITSSPVPTIAPTTILIVTDIPSQTGTPIKEPSPIQGHLDFQNESQNPKTISPSPFFQLPQINSLHIPQIKINLIAVNKTVQKPLGFFRYLFYRIVYFDKKLENTVNEVFRKLIPL